LADEVGLRRFERGASGVENNVEICVDAASGEAHSDHLADPAADAIAVVRLADSTRNGKAETGSRRPGPLFTDLAEQECHKVGT